MRIIHWLLAAALVTSSCDIFLVVDLGGATLRLCQVLLVVIILASFAQVAQRQRLLWPRGGFAILLWCMLQGLFISRSVIPGFSFQLYLLMLLPILGVFAILQLYGKSRWVERLVKTYLVSFVCVSAFGLFQFVAPALHLGYPLIAQWILHGVIPRINGFSYEPSYFATYIVMGWITLIDLRLSRARIASGRVWFWLTWFVSAALFLSTSKSAWLFMLVEGCLRLLPRIRRLGSRQFQRLSAGDLRVAVPGKRVVVGSALVLLTAATLLTVLGSYMDLNIFLAGTGLNHTASHSVDGRYRDYAYTAQVVREHPWVGLGLGGVAGRIAEIKGTPAQSVADVKLNWGFPVPVEVLAASGVVGFIPFVWFFLEITLGERSLIRTHLDDERAKWLHALIRALVFEWLCLAADQNLVRMYFWFHVTILIVVAYNLRYVVPVEPEVQPAEILLGRTAAMT